MIDANFMLGYPREFKNICLIYPPKVKDVVANKQYAYYAKFLTLSQEEIEDEMGALSDTELINSGYSKYIEYLGICSCR